MTSDDDSTTTAELRGELFGVHIPELQLPAAEYRAGFAAASLRPGERYLELGSGHGHGLLLAAAEFGAHATGVEYLDDAIERTRKAAPSAGVQERVTLVHDDLRRIDPAGFDVIHMHLGPAFHDVLAARLERLLPTDARVIAAGWRVPGWLPDPDALDAWDGGYVYRPSDPRMQAVWGARTADTIEVHVHADLRDIEPRIDGAQVAGKVAVSRSASGRGTTLLVSQPDLAGDHELTIWARCRAGRFTQRGPALSA